MCGPEDSSIYNRGNLKPFDSGTSEMFAVSLHLSLGLTREERPDIYSHFAREMMRFKSKN